jgi:hypothetical protein
MEPDLIGALEAELHEARRVARVALDRAAALAELHSIALEAAAGLRRPLRATDVERWASADEERRARLDALRERAAS